VALHAAYDLRIAQLDIDFERGIPRHTVNTAIALAHREEIDRISWVVSSDRPLPPVIERLARGDVVSVKDCSGMAGADLVFHLTAPFDWRIPTVDLVPPGLERSRAANVVTLYDVIPLSWPDDESDAGRARRRWLARSPILRSADRLLVLSRYGASSSAALARTDRARTHIVYSGVSQVEPREGRNLRPPLATGLGSGPTVSGLSRPYVLYVGGLEDPRKNVIGLIHAFSALDGDVRREHQLVLVGRSAPARDAELRRLIQSTGLADSVLLPGLVDEPTLRDLYGGCSAMVYPSLEEGFGLPIVEGMAHGAPVLSSNTTGCGEVNRHPRATFDPTDATAIADRMHDLLTEPGLADTLRAYGHKRASEFTWDRVAMRTASAYRAALADRRRRSHRRGRALAVTCPTWYGRSGPSWGALLTASALADDARVIARSVLPLGRVERLPIHPAALSPGAQALLPGTPVWALDGPQSLAAAAAALEYRPGAVLAWELDELVAGSPGATDELAPRIPRPIVAPAAFAEGDLGRALRAAALMVVAEESDARRLRLALGPGIEPLVIPPPLAHMPVGGAPDLDKLSLSSPARGRLRATRRRPLVLVARHPRFGLVREHDLRRCAQAAGALNAHGIPARVQLLGETYPFEAAGALSAVRRRSGAGGLAIAPWPGDDEIDAWSSLADAFFEPGSCSNAAARESADRALLAQRPLVSVGHRCGGGPWITALAADTGPEGLSQALAAALREPMPGLGELLEERSPRRTAQCLQSALRSRDLL